MGVKVIGVSDSTGNAYNPAGASPRLWPPPTGHPASRVFPAARRYRPREFLNLACDILVPAALENVITKENAGGIQATIIAEAANGPTTPGPMGFF